MHTFKKYNSMSFDKYIHLCNHHHNKKTEHFLHLRMLFGALLNQFLHSPSQARVTAGLLAPTIDYFYLF